MEKERSRIFISILFIIMGLSICYLPETARGQDRCTEWVAKMESPIGVVQVRRAGDTEWTSVEPNETYCPGDTVRTLGNSRAGLRLPNEGYDRLDQKTTVTFTGIEKDRTSLLELITGAFHFFSRTPRALKVTTPFVNGTVEGTEFFVRVASDHTLISVFQGNVLAANDVGSLNLASGQSAVARAGEAPKAHIVARPRDTVQWAIYYPAVIDYKPTNFPGEEAWQGMFRKSIQHYRDGDLGAAFSSLDGVPETIPDPRFYTYRAGLLLSVGRVEEAFDDIEKSLEIDATNSPAFALRSIIAVAQNRKDEALELASRAISLDPDSSAAKVALSYAYQASFQIQPALETLQEAVALSPDNALAWARLSELWMSVGDLDKALEAAQKSADFNPNLAHTQTVLGFAFLAQIKIKDAKAAFEKAISLDQAAPLPRLGLGLAKIREGDLEPGRGDIEMAVCLDPNNSLMRSYLGKAFFDEKKDKHSDNQFALAKELDPNDPTPWFYDAIRKQTLNRPVEALQDLQKSIELNDNRAVYRSRLLLDEDLAARSASLGRIYSDLGFQQLALVEGWKSINADPSNYSAHRFLADSYSALPRHEIARVSELLQSQLLQPVNITPVQPSLAESDLLILEGAGPADPAFNEFNPLFLRNRFAVQANGIVGGNDTLGGEVVQSGVWGKASYSVGAFHHETDGFRENNDLVQKLYNAFTQISLSHKTSVQAEYRHREREQGQLDLIFDPDTSLAFREEREGDYIRLGFLHRFSPRSNVIGSFIHQSLDIIQYQIPKSGVFSQDIEEQRDGNIVEFQHLFRSERFNLTSGVGHTDQDIETTFIVDMLPFETFYTPPPPLPPIAIPIIVDEDPFDPVIQNVTFKRTNIYAYSQIDVLDSLTVSIGLSADFLERANEIDRDQVNPKLGLTWHPLTGTTVRMAAFRELGNRLHFNQTIEPTQVAGFNQFFDDINGTDSRRYGAAVDQVFSHNVYGGIEYSLRELEVPLLGDPETEAPFFDWYEYFGRAYVYWTPHPLLALSAEYQYERFDRKDNPFRRGIVDARTHRVPLGLSFFHPSGMALRLKGTYYDQSGDFQKRDSDITFSGRDDFWVLDLSIQYRLPQRFGLISVGVKNLLDEAFNFQDTNAAEPTVVPERSFFGRFTLAF